MKKKTEFYTKAHTLLSKGAPIESIYELQEDYNITKEEISSYLESRKQSNAVKAAIVVKSREEQIATYNVIDQKFIERFPHLVSFRLGDNVLFYNYEGGVYKQIPDGDMEDLMDSFMFQLGLLDHRTNRKKIKDTIARVASLLARTDKRHFKDSDIINRKYKLNLKNGLFDVETMKLEEHTPEYFSTSQIPFEYNPEATAPTFEQFIKKVSNGDETTKDMIQEMFGYCIGEGNPKHKVFYLYGDTARNGKSTTAKILCGLIGKDNYSTLSLAQIAGENSSVLTQLIGKQLNFSDELSTKYIESSMLTTVSAEGIIEINPKYKSPFIHQVKSKFLVTCNDLPKFQNGQGMKHRMILIPFQYHIPADERIDRYDEVLLEKEGSGILNWAIEGAKLLKERKTFTINEQSKQDLLDNTKESNSVYAFLYEGYDFGDYDDKFDKKSMYRGYKEFCNETGVMPKGYQSFCTELKRFSNETHLIKPNNSKGNITYVGLKEKDLF